MTVKEFYEWAVKNGVENFQFVERQCGFNGQKYENVNLSAMEIIEVDEENEMVYIDNTNWEC